MSETLEQTQVEAPETGFLCREFPVEVQAGDGRTVDVRIVPYGEQIEHDDGFGGVPKGIVYREEFLPGVFDHQVNAANRVLANCEHEEGIRGIVGHGLALREGQDGFYGSFKIHDTPEGNKALLLIREGVFNSVSMEARPRKSQRTAGGLIRRVKADLVNVAFTRFGAYKRAGVLAIREEIVDETLVDEEFLPVDPNPELLARCRALGIELPQRYQAHPDSTDTPAEAGTSGDGTRQTVNDDSQEES